MISGKKKTELYEAISENIFQKRMTIQNSKDVLGADNAENLDLMMFRLNNDIWKSVMKVLGIED